MNKNIQGVGEVTVPSTPKEKIQNFWYHYKWHSVIALFLVFAILLCTLQLCSKTEYDAYILYAGSKNIGRTAEDGDVAEIVTVISALKRIAADYDENGEVSVGFVNYYYLGNEEASNTTDANDALLASDRKALSSALEHSEYYLCFISPAVYEEYHKVGNNELFIPLDQYKDSYPSAEYYSDSAILLSSTGAYKLPGLSNLPSDTLICIRRPNVLAGKSDEHNDHFDNAKRMLESILKLQIN